MTKVKRKWWIGSAALAMVAIFAVAFWPEPREPEYHGKKLSEWLTLYNEAPKEATEAVRAMGGDVVPVLLKWIQDERRGRAEKRAAKVKWLPQWVRQSSVVHTWVVKPYYKEGEAGLLAEKGFESLDRMALRLFRN